MSAIYAINEESLAEAVEIIQQGGVIVLPTDTVYGIACDPMNNSAIERIFAIKQRPRTKSIQILLPNLESVEALGLTLPEPLDYLSRRFLPGGFSPIALAKKDCRLATLREESDGERSQGIRIPDSTGALQALDAIGALAASSANISGGQSPQNVLEAYAAFGDKVPLYLDGGPTQSHVASTVVAADSQDQNGIRIIREGVISEKTLRQALQERIDGFLA